MTPVSDPVSLAGDFPPADREQWRSLVAAGLAKSGVTGDPEQALASQTYDGIPRYPLYTAADAIAEFPSWSPGAPPFVRGLPPTEAGWDVRQHHRGTDPAVVNRAILTDLENGATSIWLKLGDGALAVSDLAHALAGVHLDLAPVALDAGTHGAAAAQALLRLSAERGVTDSELAGTLGLDPIGVAARGGVDVELNALLELADAVRGYPHLSAITVDGSIYHDAGGSDSQELAISLSVAIVYLRALTDRGWAVGDAFAAIEFRYAVTADQFLSIAKLRAARRLWSRIGELSGVSPERRGQRQHAITSRAMMTRRDPWVNLLRATLAGFAAAAGGAQVITVEPFDAAIGRPDDLARRIARNTQSILREESSLARVADPAGGSWYVESITDQLAVKAWDIFTALEAAGGAVIALDSGRISTILAETRNRRADAIAHRRDPITGVSEFAFIAERPVRREPYPLPAGPQPRLPTTRYAEPFEALRDRSDARLATEGHRPKVFLACLGPVAAHSGRAGFAANLFQAGGIESISAVGEVGDLVAAFVASGCAVACLCSSDQIYADLAAPAARALKAAGARQLWRAGPPPPRAGSDADAGVDGYLYTGCDAVDVLTTTFDALAVRS